MSTPSPITLVPVDADNWRAVGALKVAEGQRDWVAEPLYYLSLCHYSPTGWRPLAMLDAEGTVVGFLMWAVDPEDGAAWLGGIIVDAGRQRRGHGRAAVEAAVDLIATEHGVTSFALSYEPENTVARALYAKLGFTETGEMEDTEIVARLKR
ncbi:GNAT family N-acetyltransferase [Phytomonospora sp. NPDC050363]|uniref:GNAT family N-acetyltransferase n=1 Tax=Phytomonospora sp. NPDC050363 TaxID=3155642 RepID=UPI0033C99BEE